METAIINFDAALTNKLHAAAMTKKEFWNKLIAYVTSDRILSKKELSTYSINDIKENQKKLKTDLKKHDFIYASFDIIDILLASHDNTSINGFWISNSEPYGYSYENSKDTHVPDILYVNDCSTGLYTFHNGVTMWFIEAMHDEYHAVNIAIYYDDTDFQIYCPIHGNYINLITGMPIGAGDDFANPKTVNDFITKETTKYSNSQLQKLTQSCCDTDDIEHMLVDILYLAKYGYYINKHDYIAEISTDKIVENYDKNAIKSEIETVFSLT